MLCIGMSTRARGGECGSVTSSMRARSSRTLVRQTWAQPRNTRLVAGEPVDHRRGGPVQVRVVGVEGQGEAAQVGDVLAHGQPAVHVQAGERGERVELRAEPVGAGLEAAGVVRGPPVVQPSHLVEPAALVVEAVRHLVADDARRWRRS